MYSLVRPLLFLLPPHAAHALATLGLAPVEHLPPVRAIVSAACRPTDPRVAVSAMGLRFPSPVGLAGGFDKDALRPRALAALGFGFLELGTVTARPQRPNPAPNLFRLPDDRALVNRLGFPNEGAERVIARFVGRGGAAATGVPVAISIGKSRDVPLDPIEPAIADYVSSFEIARRAADFVVVNVSSPNTKGLRAMQTPEIARALLAALQRVNVPKKPLLLKVAPDLDDAGLEALLAVAEEAGLDGVVATNTTIGRAGLKTDAARVAQIGEGGLSGPPLRARALDVVRRVRARLGPRVTIVGVGGIERTEHVLAYLRAGANLVQMYTGFVYEGPLVARRIARELGAELAREGSASLADHAVGRSRGLDGAETHG